MATLIPQASSSASRSDRTSNSVVQLGRERAAALSRTVRRLVCPTLVITAVSSTSVLSTVLLWL